MEPFGKHSSSVGFKFTSRQALYPSTGKMQQGLVQSKKWKGMKSISPSQACTELFPCITSFDLQNP